MKGSGKTLELDIVQMQLCFSEVFVRKLHFYPGRRFSKAGHLELEVTDFQYFPEGRSKENLDFTRLGFFISATQSETQLELDLAQVCQAPGLQRLTHICFPASRPMLTPINSSCCIRGIIGLALQYLQGACGLEARGVVKLLTFDQVLSQQATEGNATSLKLALSELLPGFEGGEYALFFENCEQLLMVSFSIRVSLYNVRSNGYIDYLPVGEDILPAFYMVCTSTLCSNQTVASE